MVVMSETHGEDLSTITWTPQQLITILYSPTDSSLRNDEGEVSNVQFLNHLLYIRLHYTVMLKYTVL